MQAEDMLRKLDGFSIFLAYNTDVDVITHIDGSFHNLFTKEEVRSAKEQKPKLLEDKVDLLTAVMDCMEKGRGNEMQITSQELINWLAENLQVENKRMGGQTGIMSNLLSNLGCEAIAYTTNLSEEQASLFEENENLKFPYVDDGELKMDHPSNCYKKIPTKKNWILEFSKNQELFGVKAKENSRFIASSPYTHENLELGEVEMKIEELAECVDCMILSGYHDLLEKYPDGTTWRDHLNSAKAFIRKVKRSSPETTIRIEFSALHRREIREAIVNEVVPLADVFSFDPNELGLLQKDIGIEGNAPQSGSPVEMSKELKKILEEICVDSVSIHTEHYFLSVSKDYLRPELVKKGFEFARNCVWTRASGKELNEENINKADDVEPSKKGEGYKKELAEELGEESFKEDGIYEGDFDIVMVPNKIYKNPEITVGLGDVVSATSFAAENALR